jgi:hypothetical protein
MTMRTAFPLRGSSLWRECVCLAQGARRSCTGFHIFNDSMQRAKRLADSQTAAGPTVAKTSLYFQNCRTALTYEGYDVV